MRIFRTTVSALILLTAAMTGWAEEPFYTVNQDLDRVWLGQVSSPNGQTLAGSSYRLSPDFRLGMGDTVVLNLWGKLEASYEITLNADGYLVVPLLGKVHVLGLTLNEAREAVRREIEKKYTNVNFELDITNVKDIMVEVLGNVNNPGMYAVSPYSFITEALVKAGGPNNNGPLSNIQLIRDGKLVGAFNLYDYIFSGSRNDNFQLKHGDLIFIPSIQNIYAIKGDIRYPGIYDQSAEPTLSRAVEIAGGMLSTPFKRKISVVRIDPATRETGIVKEVVLSTNIKVAPEEDFVLQNYDTIVVGTEYGYSPYARKLHKIVSVSGEVALPGSYTIMEGEKLSSLLKRTGILSKSAFLPGAVFTRKSVKTQEKDILDKWVLAREKDLLDEEGKISESFMNDMTRERLQASINARRKKLNVMSANVPDGHILIDFEQVIKGEADIQLEDGDSIFIPAIPSSVLVSGAVYNALSVAFEPGKPLDYYLNFTGGATDNADLNGLYVIKSNGRTESKKTGLSKIAAGDVIVVPEKNY